MQFSKCTMTDLEKALEIVNKKYDGNITFNRFDSKGFTLKVKDSKGPGHRINQSYLMGLDWANKKRMSSACWHVHGDFFDALFEVNPQAKIRSRGELITINGGNWQDVNIGSYMYPVYFSEACECNGEA